MDSIKEIQKRAYEIMLKEAEKEKTEPKCNYDEDYNQEAREIFAKNIPANIRSLKWDKLDVKVKNSGSYLFIGDVGTGKTVNAIWLARKALYQGKTARFMTVTECLNKMNDNNLSGKSLFNEILDCDLLILDDLGREKYTEKRLENFFSLINRSYGDMREIIITANNECLEKLNTISDFNAIADRIMGMCKKIEFKGQSFRRKHLNDITIN